jgi:uncharacterized membrane protein YfcA
MTNGVKMGAAIVGVVILLIVAYMFYKSAKAKPVTAAKPPAGSGSGSTVGNVSSLLSAAFGLGTAITNNQTQAAKDAAAAAANNSGLTVADVSDMNSSAYDPSSPLYDPNY